MAHLFFRILRHLEKEFRNNLEQLSSLFSLFFISFKGITTGLVPQFVTVLLPSFAKIARRIQTHTFFAKTMDNFQKFLSVLIHTTVPKKEFLNNITISKTCVLK